jgi:hypothetical protein
MEGVCLVAGEIRIPRYGQALVVKRVRKSEVAVGIAKDPGLKPLLKLQIFRGAKAPR